MARSAFFTSSNGWNTTPVIGILFVSTVAAVRTTDLPPVLVEKPRETGGEAAPWGSIGLGDRVGLVVKEETALEAIAWKMCEIRVKPSPEIWLLFGDDDDKGEGRRVYIRGRWRVVTVGLRYTWREEIRPDVGACGGLVLYPMG